MLSLSLSPEKFRTTHMQMNNIISTDKKFTLCKIYPRPCAFSLWFIFVLSLIFSAYNNRRIPNVEQIKIEGLYPDTLYYFWLAARSQRGEGATSPSIPIRTKQYGKIDTASSHYFTHSFIQKRPEKKTNQKKKICVWWTDQIIWIL